MHAAQFLHDVDVDQAWKFGLAGHRGEDGVVVPHPASQLGDAPGQEYEYRRELVLVGVVVEPRENVFHASPWQPDRIVRPPNRIETVSDEEASGAEAEGKSNSLRPGLIEPVGAARRALWGVGRAHV